MDKVKFVTKDGGMVPTYETPNAAGADIRTNEDFVLYPGHRMLVHTGLFIELPEGHEAQIRPRSGCALKYGLVVLNTPGTVDSNYRGEVCVIAVNISNEMLQINDGDRIAQAVLCPVHNSYNVSLDIVKDKNELSETERGSDGFNSTGLK
jgi:dUTP pyrophosphatase